MPGDPCESLPSLTPPGELLSHQGIDLAQEEGQHQVEHSAADFGRAMAIA